MLINRTAAPFRGFAGSWEDWCDGKFPGQPDLIAKCKSQPYGPATLAPWTDVGALQRGLPKPESVIVSAITGSTVAPTSTQEVSQVSIAEAGLFGVPNTMLLVGGAVLAGGLGLLYLKKQNRGSRRSRR